MPLQSAATSGVATSANPMTVLVNAHLIGADPPSRWINTLVTSRIVDPEQAAAQSDQVAPEKT